MVQMLSQLLTTNHKHEEFLLDGTCDPEAEAGQSPLLSVDKHAKVSGWDTTLSKTHDMSKKSQLLVSSLVRVPPLLPMLLWVAWRGQCNCMLSCSSMHLRVTIWRSWSISMRCGRRCGSGRRSRRCAWRDFLRIDEIRYLLSSLVFCFLTLRLHLSH